MTTQDLNGILAAIQPLDQFANQTPAPRGWHAQWQAIYQEAVNKLRMVAAEKPAPPPPPAPANETTTKGAPPPLKGST